MNQIIQPDNFSDVPWPTSRERARVPDTSMLPGSETSAPAAVDLLNSAVQGAHDTLDRFADRAAPAVQQLGESVSAAEDALYEKTDQLRVTRDAWMESLSCAVRDRPLASLAAAVAVGAVLARLLGRSR